MFILLKGTKLIVPFIQKDKHIKRPKEKIVGWGSKAQTKMHTTRSKKKVE